MLRPSSFCVWSDERYVVKDGQKVYAKKEFDFDLGDKWFCESCLDWRADVEELNPCCSICGQSTSLVLKDCKGTGGSGYSGIITHRILASHLSGMEGLYWTNPSRFLNGQIQMV